MPYNFDPLRDGSLNSTTNDISSSNNSAYNFDPLRDGSLTPSDESMPDTSISVEEPEEQPLTGEALAEKVRLDRHKEKEAEYYDFMTDDFGGKVLKSGGKTLELMGIVTDAEAAGFAELLGLRPLDRKGRSVKTTKKGDITLINQDYSGYRSFSDVIQIATEDKFKLGAGRAIKSTWKSEMDPTWDKRKFIAGIARNVKKQGQEPTRELMEKMADAEKDPEKKRVYSDLANAESDERLKDMFGKLESATWEGRWRDSEVIGKYEPDNDGWKSVYVKQIGGLGLDWALDPLTWMGAGAGQAAKAGNHVLSNAGKVRVLEHTAKNLSKYSDDALRNIAKNFGDDVIRAGKVSIDDLVNKMWKASDGNVETFGKYIDDIVESVEFRKSYDYAKKTVEREIEDGMAAKNTLELFEELKTRSKLNPEEKRVFEMAKDNYFSLERKAKKGLAYKYGAGKYRIGPGELTLDVSNELATKELDLVNNPLQWLQDWHSKNVRSRMDDFSRNLSRGQTIYVPDTDKAKVRSKNTLPITPAPIPEGKNYNRMEPTMLSNSMFAEEAVPEIGRFGDQAVGIRPGMKKDYIGKERNLFGHNVTESEALYLGDNLDPRNGLPEEIGDDLYFKKIQVENEAQKDIDRLINVREKVKKLKAQDEEQIAEVIKLRQQFEPTWTPPEKFNQKTWEESVDAVANHILEDKLEKAEFKLTEWIDDFVSDSKIYGKRKSEVVARYNTPEGVRILPQDKANKKVAEELPGWEKLEDVFVPTQVENALKRTQVFGVRQVNYLESITGKWVSLWKEGLTGYMPGLYVNNVQFQDIKLPYTDITIFKGRNEPFALTLPTGFAFHRRNARNNLYQMYLGGAALEDLAKNSKAGIQIEQMIRKEGPESYKSVKLLKKYGLWNNKAAGIKNGKIKTSTGAIDIRDALRGGMDTGVGQAKIRSRDFSITGSSLEKFGDKNEALKLGQIGNKEIQVKNVGADVGDSLENSMRWGFYVDQVRQGKTYKEAGKSVKTFLYDYGDLSFADRSIRQFIPFYTYMKNNLIMHAELIKSGKIGRYYPLAKVFEMGVKGDKNNAPPYVESPKEVIENVYYDTGLPYAGIPGAGGSDLKDKQIQFVSNFGIAGNLLANKMRDGDIWDKYALGRELGPYASKAHTIGKNLPLVGAVYEQLERLPKSYKILPEDDRRNYDMSKFKSDSVRGLRFIGTPIYESDPEKQRQIERAKIKKALRYMRYHKTPPVDF